MAIQLSPLCKIPIEILEEIALDVVLTEPLGPPAPLRPLLLTCVDINRVLTFENCPSLYARILRAKFDLSGPTRRFDQIYSLEMAYQLREYCGVLRFLRSGNVFHPRVMDVFLNVFAMLSENDGKNLAQLQHARVNQFVDEFVRLRLYEHLHHGWPVDNAINSLALWIMWMTTTQKQLADEPERNRQQIINMVLPFVVVAFRYPTAHAPPNHFHLPLDAPDDGARFPHSVLTAHGPYPLYRNPGHVLRFPHFGHDVELGWPLIAVAAKLIYFSRREVIPFGIPPHLLPTREHATDIGRHDVGPTQADVVEFNSFQDTKLPPPSKWNWNDDLTEEELELVDRGLFCADLKCPSSKWDDDWKRWSGCMDPMSYGGETMYTPGTLAGLWQGRMLIPNEGPYMDLMATPDYPVNFSESSTHVTTVPIYMRLREHHCISPQMPVGCGGMQDGFDDGLQNAYFPSMMMQENASGVLIHAEGTSTLYEKYVEGQPNSHDEATCTFCVNKFAASRYNSDFAEVGLGMDDDDEVCDGKGDIIVCGSTDLRHGQAWNHFQYYGRVRLWDGLIAILRVPRDQRLGRVIFYGYIVGGQNFVGNWRPAGADPSMPAWECAFTMSRRE